MLMSVTRDIPCPSTRLLIAVILAFALGMTAGCTVIEPYMFDTKITSFDNKIELTPEEIATIQAEIKQAVASPVKFRTLVAGQDEAKSLVKVCGIIDAQTAGNGKSRKILYIGNLNGRGGAARFRLEAIGANKSTNASISGNCISSGLNF